MHIIDVDQNTERWFEERRGKISGTRLGEVYSTRAYTKGDMITALEAAGVEFSSKATVPVLEALLDNDAKVELLKMAPKKIGFYEVLAERLAIDPDDEDRRDRGHRLEEDVVKLFEEMTGKKVERVGICVSDVHPGIINSPDGLIKQKGKKDIYNEAVEVKCLSSARHLQAVIENQVPDEFNTQKIQYFVVNKHLERLHFVFHDDRIVNKELQTKIITIERSSLGNQPELFERYQLAILDELDRLVAQYAF
jgi:hypothetical protein